MCVICDRLELWKKNANPYFICEFKHSIFVLGDHQYFDGYSLLLLKDHVKDITDLPLDVQQEYFGEVMLAGKALQKHFSPYRLNYSCLGNLVEHVHFHIFPRYEEELKKTEKKNPWEDSQYFDEKKLISEKATSIADGIRKTLFEIL